MSARVITIVLDGCGDELVQCCTDKLKELGALLTTLSAGECIVINAKLPALAGATQVAATAASSPLPPEAEGDVERDAEAGAEGDVSELPLLPSEPDQPTKVAEPVQPEQPTQAVELPPPLLPCGCVGQCVCQAAEPWVGECMALELNREPLRVGLSLDGAQQLMVEHAEQLPGSVGFSLNGWTYKFPTEEDGSIELTIAVGNKLQRMRFLPTPETAKYPAGTILFNKDSLEALA
jgi:hypothetical protein